MISVNYLINHSEHAKVACIKKIMELITIERKCQHRESNRHRFESWAEANLLSSFYRQLTSQIIGILTAKYRSVCHDISVAKRDVRDTN